MRLWEFGAAIKFLKIQKYLNYFESDLPTGEAAFLNTIICNKYRNWRLCINKKYILTENKKCGTI